MIKDTIAAIATAMPHSGIGIVRMSGPESFEIIDKILIEVILIMKSGENSDPSSKSKTLSKSNYEKGY